MFAVLIVFFVAVAALAARVLESGATFQGRSRIQPNGFGFIEGLEC